MEGFGYKNWSGHDYEDSSGYDTSTPPTYTSETYGFAAKRANPARGRVASTSDIYDFDYSDGGSKGISSDLTNRQTRRMSTDDRARQILDKAVSERSMKREKPPKDDKEVFSSFQDSWNELMQDLESVPGSSPTGTQASSPRTSSPQTPGGLESFGTPKGHKETTEKGSPFFSPTGSDSFEISAADLEVGAIAARRSKEKAMERRRGRQSFDPERMPPQMSPQTSPKLSSVMSPDLRGKGAASTSPRFRNGGAMESVALSSIDKTDTVKVSGSESHFFGGADKSDGELFKMLTENRMKDFGVHPKPTLENRQKSNSFDVSELSAEAAPVLKRGVHSDEGIRTDLKPMPTAIKTIEEADQSAEYSDEFDDTDAGEVIGSKTSQMQLTGPTKVSDSVESTIIRTAAAAAEASSVPPAPSPALSAKELERRKSIQSIQDRWFSNSPAIVSPAAVPNASPASPLLLPTTSTGSATADQVPPVVNLPPAVVAVNIAAISSPLHASDDSPMSAASSDTLSASNVKPFGGEAPVALASGQHMVRPSPLVTSANKLPSSSAAGRLLDSDRDFVVSRNGSFSAPSAVRESAEDYISVENSVEMAAKNDSGNSIAPSPPSSAAPSAAASMENTAYASILRNSNLSRSAPTTGSAINVFPRVSTADPEQFESAHAGKTRVSFDLNRNQRYEKMDDGVDQNYRRSAAMSVDSLEFSSLPSRDDANAMHGSEEISQQLYGKDRSHFHNGELDFRNNFDNFMSGRGNNISNSRYSPDIPESPAQGRNSNASESYYDPTEQFAKANRPRPSGYEKPTASSLASQRASGEFDTEPRVVTKKVAPLPMSLDVVIPSVDELHAQLAMITAAEKRRREHRVDRSSDRGSWEQHKGSNGAKKKPVSSAVTAGTVLSAPSGQSSGKNNAAGEKQRQRSISPPPPPLPAPAPEWDSLSRLEQSNARLNRQFEDLSEEIKLWRASSSTATTPPRAPLQQRLQNYSGRPPKENNSRAAQGIAGDFNREKRTNYGPSGAFLGDSAGAANEWDEDALSAVRDILKESEALRRKEKQLIEREKLLELREKLVNQSAERRMKEKVPLPKEPARIAELESEVVNLKSQLFQAQQHIFQLHAATKAIVDGGSGEEKKDHGEQQPPWDPTHYFELTCAYLKRLGHAPQGMSKGVPMRATVSVTKKNTSSEGVDNEDIVRNDLGEDGLGGKWMNGEYFIPHTIYMKLQHDKLSSESILEASQKENERLMGVLKTQEKDMRSKDATYFDQQAELVKEINKLKNQLEKYSGGSVVDGDTMVPGESGLGEYPSSGIGGVSMRHEVRSGSGVIGRKAFEAEAIIWRLQEQLAEAEEQARERENKLKQTIGRLTLENQQLMKSEKGNLKGSGGLIQKSEAYKTYFSGQLLGASAGWNEFDKTDVPPPPPIEEDKDLRNGQNKDLESLSNQDIAISELQLALKNERKKHQEEVEALRSRLKWFADTQDMINSINEERDNLAEQVKHSASHRSPSPGKVRSNGATGADSSFHSSIGNYRRHPSDTKKIKELEATVNELREALRKRFPDSISNLLHATSSAGIGADPAELEKARNEISVLKEEIQSIERASERKLRGLRQEFEKMRVVYEDRIINLEATGHFENQDSRNTQAKSTSPSAAAIARRAANAPIDAQGKPWSSNKLDPTKNLNQALAKIRELEAVESRLRTFYTRKIEDMQRRYEIQIRALKRTGHTVPTSVSGVLTSRRPEHRDDVRNEEDNSEKDTSMNSNATASTGSENVESERLLLLQNELLKMAEELGRAKKTISELENNSKVRAAPSEPSLVMHEAQHAPMTASSVLASPQIHDNHAIASEQQQTTIRLLQQQVRDLMMGSSLSSNDTVSQQTIDKFQVALREKDKKIQELEDRSQTLQNRLDETSQLLHKESLIQINTRAEWTESQKRLVDKIEALQNENMNQRDAMKALQATPQMSNFLAIESHLNSLEAKLSKRNTELQQALDEGKKAMHMERIRLQALHEQEMREKDEQLRVFETQLEQLVSALRKEASVDADRSVERSAAYQ